MFTQQVPFLNRSNSRQAHWRQRVDTLNTILNISNGFPYSRRLSAHTSCVNALSFSRNNSRFLASGGDDLIIRIWDFHSEDVKKPLHHCLGPRANIFTLDFSAGNKFLISGGADETILRYDVSYLTEHAASRRAMARPDNTSRIHNGSIRSVACHPRNEDLFYSASEDGQLGLHDCRATSTSTSIRQFDSELADVKCHPTFEHLIVTADLRGRVCLWDTRMAFGTHSDKVAVQKYTTNLSKKPAPSMVSPETSSLCFNGDGTLLAVTIDHYFPTLYSLHDENPLAVFSGKYRPDGSFVPPDERTYKNSCTMKHGSFGTLGASDEYYCTGSDDFCAYGWKIPSLTDMRFQQEILNISDWQAQGRTCIGFTSSANGARCVPVDLSTPSFRLTGHKSIVNTVLVHSSLPHIVTSGIENDIILHSSMSSSLCTSHLDVTPTRVREISDFENLDQSDAENIRLFDELLMYEEPVDIFARAHGAGNDLQEEDKSEDDSGDEDMTSTASDDAYA